MSEQARCLRPGTKLRYPLYESNGMLLLAAGSEITPRLRSLLDRRGVRLELQASVRVARGTPHGLEIPVRSDRLTIGRRAECEVRPDSDIVSGLHCRIIKRSYGVFVIDLKSTNGTFLNEERVVGETELSDGDELRVGNMIFRVNIFAAVAADNEDDQEALDAWILAEPFANAASEPSGGPTRLINTEGVFREDEPKKE